MRRAISQVSFLRSFASLNENLTWSNTKWYWQRIAQENLEEGRIKRITSNKDNGHGWFVLPRFGPRRPSPRWGVHSRTGLFQPFPSLHRSLKIGELFFLLKDHLRPRKDHHTLWCLLLAFTSLQHFGGSLNGSQNSTHKWTQRWSTHYLSMKLTRH